MIRNPSWLNAGFLAWSVAATLIPGVPGSWVARLAKAGAKWVGLRGLRLANKLRNGFRKRLAMVVTAKAGQHAHHIIPVELADQVVNRFGKSFAAGEGGLIEFLMNPSNGMFVDAGRHSKNSKAYNSALKAWLKKNPNGTFEEFFNFAEKKSKEMFGG